VSPNYGAGGDHFCPITFAGLGSHDLVRLNVCAAGDPTAVLAKVWPIRRQPDGAFETVQAPITDEVYECLGLIDATNEVPASCKGIYNANLPRKEYRLPALTSDSK
jgi:hypothetical protein